ncbi:MAG TPA: DUF1453 domain-containing protein [Gammaproteobacteria bacterium]|nr:DUF1453 domain-containing protein [Gammaproteobacteria bacterium]
MHPSLESALNTLWIGALVLFVLYRRFRRNFGRQALRPARLWLRVVILALVCVLLLVSPFRTGMSFLAAAIGAALGIGLGVYALLHTRFESTAQGRYYTPNGYIGLGVTALLLGRLIYRFTVIYPAMHTAVQQTAQQAAQNPHVQVTPFASFQRSPLTLGIYFLLAGYYICYYLGVLQRAKTLLPDSTGADSVINKQG